jgi:hypothetical protein
MTHTDEFDQILDDALAEYREAEPLAGLEGRVLQRLRLQAEHRRKLSWRWSALAATATALAIAAWIALGNGALQEVAAPSAVQKQAPSPEPQPHTAETRAANERSTAKRAPGTNTGLHRAHVSAQASVANIEHAPMLERFPLPAPLKREERMLLALAATHPEILMDKPDEDREIVIAPISISPLADETGGHQGED